VNPPLAWTLDDVAAATGGEVTGEARTPISAVSVDSRTIGNGSLFVAIAGEHFDGHEFAAPAMANGAAAAVVRNDWTGSVTPRVAVPDTGAALRDLAAYHRAGLDVPVVAVTGSTGKTSTKDMLARIMAGSWASPASFNNEVGVPLTVLSTPPDARFLVTEVGSRGKGHIAWLMPAIRPDVAVITNLGVVHLETFGTRENLADAKWELVDGLHSEGTAVLPFDQHDLTRRRVGKMLTFGSKPGADVWYDRVELDDKARPSFRLSFGDNEDSIRMRMAGGHQPQNAVAAAAAALAVGVDFESVLAGLERATGSPGRMEIHHGRVTVINDAYNANPDSMEAALRTAAAMPGRHVAVLGLMVELGVVEDAEHRRIGALARSLGFAALVVVGADPGLAAAAGAIARRVKTADEAARILRPFLRRGDVVLVKASHSVGLESLALRLADEVAS
jgi:UDP-N-acetylmuramoyl-tripeptide--D-alanyl-D-alanine ligase